MSILGHIGNYNTATTRTHVRFQFSTHVAAGANVAPSSAFEAADLRIYRANDSAAFSATQRSSAAGITMTSPFDSLTGVHDVDIDLSDNTDSGFYAAGYTYSVVLAPDETVDSQAITGVVLCTFEIGVPKVDIETIKTQAVTCAAPVTVGVYVGGTGAAALASGVDVTKINGTSIAGTSTQVAAAFLNFFNVATPTGTVNSLPAAAPDAAGGLPISAGGDLDLDNRLPSATSIGNVNIVFATDFAANYSTSLDRWVVQLAGATHTSAVVPTVTTLTNLPAITTNWLTATGIADDAITAAKIANGAIDAATFAADVDAEILSYIVDDATRIDASALNTATVTTIPAILDDTDLIDDGTSGLAKIATDVAAILVDTGTTLDGKINTIDGIVDDILVDTAVIGALGAGLTAIIGADGDTLKTLSDQIDGLSTSAAPQLLVNTTIATLASQTSFTLTAGSADDDAYNGAIIVVTDQSTATQKAVGSISDYTGSTRTVTLSADPGIFTMATGDTVDILAAIGSAPSAAAIRAEIDSNSTQLAAIVADTNELQTDWVNGGRLDLILDARASQTSVDDLPTNAELATALGTADDATLAAIAALETHGDSTWATATGFSTHSAADVWAVATRVLTAGTNIQLPSNGLVNVTTWTVGITGNITGNLSGSVGSVTGAVGSVTGAVGSVTGNVGGNVTGSVGSVLGGINTTSGTITTLDALDTAQDTQHGTTQTAIADLPTNSELATALGTADDAVLAAISNLNNISAADVNAQVLDVLNVDTFAQPGQEAPAATTTLSKMIAYLYKAFRNKKTQTATDFSLFADDATTVDQKTTVSDDGTTFTQEEIGSGP